MSEAFSLTLEMEMNYQFWESQNSKIVLKYYQMTTQEWVPKFCKANARGSKKAENF